MFVYPGFSNSLAAVLAFASHFSTLFRSRSWKTSREWVNNGNQPKKNQPKKEEQENWKIQFWLYSLFIFLRLCLVFVFHEKKKRKIFSFNRFFISISAITTTVPIQFRHDKSNRKWNWIDKNPNKIEFNRRETETVVLMLASSTFFVRLKVWSLDYLNSKQTNEQ